MVGPQPLDELRQLADRYGASFNAGARIEPLSPPALLPPERIAPIEPPNTETLSLLFALEDLPADSREAINCLALWTHAEHTGGLISTLRKKGWVKTLTLEPLYHFRQQAVLAVEIALTEAGIKASSQIAHAFFDWLTFLERQPDLTELQAEYTRLAQRTRATLSLIHI